MLRGILVIIVLSLFFALFAENEIVYEIRIEGTQNVEKSLIMSAIDISVGDNLTGDKVSKSIKNLYNLAVFDNVSMETAAYKDGLLLTVKVTENPIVNQVKYSGNKTLKTDKINEMTQLKKGSYWSQNLMMQTRKKMLDDYVKRGFQLATVEFTTEPIAGNKVNVTVQVKEGEKIAIKRIRFIGNTEVADKALLKKMKTKPANLLRSGKFEQENFDKDLENLVKYYNKLGYIDARVLSTENKQLDNKYLEIQISLYEGNKFKFGQLRVKGNNRFTTDMIQSKFKFKANDPFDMEKFDKQLQAVSSLYYEEGYIYAQFDHELEKVGEKVNINLNITENTRAKIHKILINGNRKTKEKVIRRQLEIAPGDFFQQSKVLRSQQNIYNLGFFEPEMIPNYKPINNNGDIDLTINVKDKYSGTANGGVGYNSLDKFVGQLSVSHNNLFGNAWSTSLKWEFGGSTQNLEYDFTNPNFYDNDMLLGFNLYHTKKEWTSLYYEVSTQGASVRVGEPISLVNRARAVFGYSLYAKKYQITDWSSIDTSTNSNLVELDKLGWRYTSSGSLTLSRDTRDNVYFPTQGSQATIYSELAGGPFNGDFDYFKQIAQVSWFIDTYFKLALRNKWRFGYVEAYGATAEVPPDEKFFLGGTGPDGIRGYAERSITAGNGGTREIIYSSELGYPIGGDTVIGLLFFDAGNCFTSLRDVNVLEFKKGAGLGVRIRSPFGLIGFDYAHNFENRKWEPHFQFGTNF